MTVEASAGNTRASFWSARLEDASTSAAVPPHGAVMTVGTEVQMAATDSGGEKVRVAVLGTGIMGSAMARNLVSAGLRTTVWDRSPTATAPPSRAGALVTASSAEAVQDAPVGITMLPPAAGVHSAIFAGGGVEALAEGAVWAQTGTVG